MLRTCIVARDKNQYWIRTNHDIVGLIAAPLSTVRMIFIKVKQTNLYQAISSPDNHNERLISRYIDMGFECPIS